MKINAIDHRRDVVSKGNKMLPPLPLFRVVTRAKGDVMNRAGSDAARVRIGHTKQIDHATGGSFILRSESKTIIRLINQPVTKSFRQQFCSAFVPLQSRGDAVKSTNR